MRFLAHERFPPGLSEDDLRRELEALAHEARERGVRAEDLEVDRASGRAVGVFLADDADDVRAAHQAAGIPCDEVLPTEAWSIGLVAPPRT